MRRLMTFLMGVVTGAILLFAALHYHLIRADDGLHFVRKVDSKLAATYVDIRGFTVADWTQHPDVAAALMNSDQRELLEGAATDALQNGIDQFINRNDGRR